MIEKLKAALRKAKSWAGQLIRPQVIVQQIVQHITRQVIYIQRPALKQVAKKPARCCIAELTKAGQMSLSL